MDLLNTDMCLLSAPVYSYYVFIVFFIKRSVFIVGFITCFRGHDGGLFALVLHCFYHVGVPCILQCDFVTFDF